MIRKYIFTALLLLSFSFSALSQAADVTVRILKAEDERRFDGVLESLLKNASPAVRARAALAAGRIGDERAVAALALLVESGDENVRAVAAFAIGEIESVKAADIIIRLLNNPQTPGPVRAKLVEAAGKIAAANAKDEKAKELGKAILDTLEAENGKGIKQNRDVVLMGITAALRARPEGTGVVVAKFLTNPDARVRADVANTLSRVRAKNANGILRAMLASDADPIARANAARALGAAEDKEASDVLLKAATGDADERVRISAIRPLGILKDAKAGDRLLERGEKLFANYKKSKFTLPAEKNEILEITVALGLMLTNSGNRRADALIREFQLRDNLRSPQFVIARLRIGAPAGDGNELPDLPDLTEWKQYSAFAQFVGELASLEPASEEVKKIKPEAPNLLRRLARAAATADPAAEGSTIFAAPDLLREYAKFKTADLDGILRDGLASKDIFVRAAAAELIADLPASPENISALRSAFEYASANDIKYNDAILAIIDALIKIDRVGSMETWGLAIISPDHLVRRRVRDEIPEETRKITSKELLFQVNKPLGPGTRMGQVLNTDADYRRSASRKNGTVKAVLTTEKGMFTIDLLPEDAPLTVDNFIKLAKSGYFNGLEVHRVVPNFVMQDGDPRGDGNGGPGWSIRCELNTVPFERGAVGMALSGKDTGGSQWFVTHSPQPHLDGGYTVFGRVNETGMKIVDNIVRGDKIISVKIVESGLPQRTRRTRR
ncbi:MAG: peptidylprolyl isomerase [Pyrinomonadaceae bacterium]